jgi:hypothetical protein
VNSNRSGDKGERGGGLGGPSKTKGGSRRAGDRPIIIVLPP